MNLLIGPAAPHAVLVEITTALGFANALIAFGSTATLFTLKVRRYLRRRGKQRQAAKSRQTARVAQDAYPHWEVRLGSLMVSGLS